MTGFCCACAGTDGVPAIANVNSERGKAASRQIDHGLFPLVAVQTVILLVTWHERERDFTLVSFACK